MNENIIYALNEAADYLESLNEADKIANRAKLSDDLNDRINNRTAKYSKNK